MEVLDLKKIPYKKALSYQEELVEEVIKDERKQFLIFCYHPSIVTLGRGIKRNKEGSIDDIKGWKGDVAFTSRGGRATYHGPEQLVIYPIFKLKEKKLIDYLRGLEDVMMKTLAHFGLHCTNQPSFMTLDKNNLNFTGVWCRDKKVCSIGIAMKKNVVFHGLAVHIFKTYISGLKPCGFSPSFLSSLEEQGVTLKSKEEIKTVFLKHFKKLTPS